METNVRTPLDIFNLPQHLVVPLFQRPYVWDEAEQWLPLWQDVRRMAELRLSDPTSKASHFLGAVVVQAQENWVGNLPARNIVDGQQRLTTLQLLMDAAGAVLDELGLDLLAGQLETLTHNLELFVADGQTRLKLRHTNKDQAAYDEVMNAEPPVQHASLKHSGALVTRAHRFFVRSVSEWLTAEGDVDVADRGAALALVLTRGLQLVVIDLQAQENSQEIFETLNGRGTPLTAADLVKNFVFQRLEMEGVDTRRAYAEDWPFETTFWESEVSVGRYTISRGSLFLNQWLVSRTGEEVSPKSTFTRFKHYFEHECGRTMSELLGVLKRQTQLYEQWTTRAARPDGELDRTELAVYRMQVAGIELLRPLLIWLHDPDLSIPPVVADGVIAAAESWVVRRQLLSLQSGDLGRVVADLILTHRTTPPGDLVERVQTHLSRLSTASTYWPGDQELAASLVSESVYRRLPRGRLRMALEAVEDRLRGAYAYPPISRQGYPIEHLLPRKWETHWPVLGLEAEIDRAAHVHRLGNLTLLTTSLNASVSNGPWEGAGGKREKLAKHDVFLLNRMFREPETTQWNEERIDRRSASMIQALLQTWPVPEGHTGEILDVVSSEQTWVEVKHLVAAGLLVPGTRLTPRVGKWPPEQAVVMDDGTLSLLGQTFHTPSGAGTRLKGGATNGWVFWHLDDGRPLADVRSVYRGDKPRAGRGVATFDWSRLHRLLDALPAGSWTSYGDLADAIGTAAQPLGNHISSCAHCVNAHRVLTGDGRVSPGFTWSDPDDRRDPAGLLREEGVVFVEHRADARQRLTADDLVELVGPADG